MKLRRRIRNTVQPLSPAPPCKRSCWRWVRGRKISPSCSRSAAIWRTIPLPFRKSRNGRFCFDFDRAQIERLEFQPFVLSVEEDFIRYDSGKVRHFRGINDDLQLNTAFRR